MPPDQPCGCDFGRGSAASAYIRPSALEMSEPTPEGPCRASMPVPRYPAAVSTPSRSDMTRRPYPKPDNEEDRYRRIERLFDEAMATL